MPLVIQGLASHDISDADIFRNPSRCWEIYQDLDIFNTVFIVNITGNLIKGILFPVSLHLPSTTQIHRSILGTGSLALAKLTISSLNISTSSSRTGAKSPLALIGVIRKQRLK